jgi:hydroxyquinol 1,2-dioxygenase
MADFNDQTLTQAVVDRFGETPDPRLRQLLSSLTRHLHAFVRETEPTFDEWLQTVLFLTATGQKCDDVRQEFILLSDVMGISMLVDAVNHRMSDGATESTVLGPFFVENAPRFEPGADITGGMEGEPLFVDVVIRSAGGAPLPGATVDVWQSDSEGFYDVQRDDRGEGAKLRGTLTADAQGRVRFWSVLPTAYPIPYDGPVGELLKATRRHPWRPAHLHFKIAALGHETLVTHLFVEGDPYLDSDAVFGVKESLICQFTRHEAGAAPDGRPMERPWRSLNHDFVLKDLTRTERTELNGWRL